MRMGGFWGVSDWMAWKWREGVKGWGGVYGVYSVWEECRSA